MIYVDTSVIVKLYIKEDYSLEVSDWVKTTNEPMPLTGFHDLEFTNAVYLKQFRKELAPDDVHSIISRYHHHERIGVYYRPPLDWTATLNYAVELSKNHTGEMGTRSLDILHVATALSLKAHTFTTLDARQSGLASRAGFKTIFFP